MAETERADPRPRGRLRRAARWVCAAALLVLISFYGVLQLSRSRTFQIFGGLVHRVDTADRAIALTVDDGPEPAATEELLAVLRRHGARATFFLIGTQIERHPELARAIALGGHQLGNHSYSHRRMIFKPPAFIRSEVDQTNRLLREVGYGGPLMFRPPYGKKLLYLPLYLREKGIPTILWDLEPDSYESIAGSTERIVAHVLERVRPGSILLLHAMNRAASRAAVEPLLVRLGQQGYRFVTVEELLRRGRADRSSD